MLDFWAELPGWIAGLDCRAGLPGWIAGEFLE